MEVPKPSETTLSKIEKWSRGDKEKKKRLVKMYIEMYEKVAKEKPNWSKEKIEAKARSYVYVEEQKEHRSRSKNFIGIVVRKQPPINYLEKYWRVAEWLSNSGAPLEKTLTKESVMKNINNINDEAKRTEMIKYINGIKHTNEEFFRLDKFGQPIDLRTFTTGNNPNYGEPYPKKRYIRSLDMIVKEVNGKDNYKKARMTLSDDYADPESDLFIDPPMFKVLRFSAFSTEGKDGLALRPSTRTEFVETDYNVMEILKKMKMIPLHEVKQWMREHSPFDVVITKGLLIELITEGGSPRAVVGDPDYVLPEGDKNENGYTVWLSSSDVKIPEASEVIIVGVPSKSTAEGREGEIFFNGMIISDTEVTEDIEDIEKFDVEEEKEEIVEDEDDFWK